MSSYPSFEDPNQLGLAGNFKADAIFLGGLTVNLGLPKFISSFLYNGITVNAGADTTICSDQSIILGATPQPGISYQWDPMDHLSDPQSAQPVFQFNNLTGENQEFHFFATAFNQFCSKQDSVTIVVYPGQEKSISGSRSVCPGVEEVDYWVNPTTGFNYEWTVNGGEMVGEKTGHAIQVNWGPTNPDAYVQVITANEFGCPQDSIHFDVRINVELETEIPNGIDEVCSNLANNNLYSIIKTNGSVYHWGVDGGQILTGQGTNEVVVDWEGLGKKKIWVQEESITIDTVCHGVSDTLEILVFLDSTEINIDYVSIDGDFVDIIWDYKNVEGLSDEIEVLRSTANVDDWQVVATIPKESTSFRDNPATDQEAIIKYRIQGTSSCEQEIRSTPHNTILLDGENDEEKNSIYLEWNPYKNWRHGVKYYEIWRNLDDQVDNKKIKSTGPDVTALSLSNALDGFVHRFRIKAVEELTNHASWSNEAVISFDHEIMIPNVITPNGDDINDTFEIQDLEAYEENLLKIFNRYGDLVFTQRNYRSGWSGAGLSPGVYYYEFLLDLQQRLHGWLQIIR